MTKTLENVENNVESAVASSQSPKAWVKPEVVKLDLETAQQTAG